MAPLAVLKCQARPQPTTCGVECAMLRPEPLLSEAGVRAVRWRPASSKALARRQRADAGLADTASKSSCSRSAYGIHIDILHWVFHKSNSAEHLHDDITQPWLHPPA